MILQALTELYETLTQSGKLPALGWSEAKISFELLLSEDGELLQLIDVREQRQMGKRTVLATKPVELPAPVKRAVNISPNFLWDHSGYLLGVDDKGKPQRTKECFEACKALHERLLAEVDTTAAHAVLAFFQKWDPKNAHIHPALATYWEELLAGGNLTFRWDGGLVHEDPAIRRAWERHYNDDSDGIQGICLVTGEQCAIEPIHPAIKSVPGAQSSGAALVSFNAPAFCSYGKDQNYNAPTGRYAAFAYSSALNYLLADKANVFRMGGDTVVCWAKNAQDEYQKLFAYATMGTWSDTYSAQDMAAAVKKLCAGEAVAFDEKRLDPDMEFYILCLSPNAARLSVRFFLRNFFGRYLRSLQAHQARLEIVRAAKDPYDHLPLWRLLGETVNQNSKDKAPSPVMAGEVLRSILMDTPYPATLLNGVMLRITAEHEITRGRAAIIKAYYLKNTNPQVPKEVLTVSLNPDSTNVPYTLGRLFSVLESIQEAANPGINATIKDKYFNAASSTPAHVFPVLTDLAQKHLRKLEPGRKIFFERQLQEVTDKLGETLPAHLTLPMKGSFQLGYYHQNQKRYEKKEDK